MEFFKRNKGKIAAASENLSDANSIRDLYNAIFDDNRAHISYEKAMGIPAVWASITTITNVITSLPFHVHKRTVLGNEVVRDTDRYAKLFTTVNKDGMTLKEWLARVITDYCQGRHLSFVEKTSSGLPTNIWPLNRSDITVRVTGRKCEYIDTVSNKVYQSDEIIDLVYQPGENHGEALNPFNTHAELFRSMIAAERYSARVFENGGVTPFFVKVPDDTTPEAAAALTKGITKGLTNGGHVFPIQQSNEIVAIGGDPEKSQLLATKQYHVTQVSQIWGVPPVFLQDLTHGTYSNTEQLGRHFSQYCIGPIISKLENQIRAKVFGEYVRDYYVRIDMNGLMRGDLIKRYAAYAQAHRAGFMTANEIREFEELPPAPEGDKLIVQGAEKTLESLDNVENIEENKKTNENNMIGDDK